MELKVKGQHFVGHLCVHIGQIADFAHFLLKCIFPEAEFFLLQGRDCFQAVGKHSRFGNGTKIDELIDRIQIDAGNLGADIGSDLYKSGHRKPLQSTADNRT